jgi:hypothetical protein
VDDRGIFESARQLFPEYEVEVLEDRSVSPEVSLSSGRHGYVITSRDNAPVSRSSRIDAIVELEFALSRAIAASLGNDFVHLHAAGCVVNGQAVLALGRSGAGKSSLAASMLARGFPTLGDDTVFLNSRGFAEPFKRLMKLSVEVLGELGIVPESTLHWDREWPEAWLDPRDGPGWADEAPVAVIALAQHDSDVSLHLEPVASSETLNALLHSVMVTGMPARAGFDRLLRIAESAKTFRMKFRSSIEAAEVLCDMLK